MSRTSLAVAVMAGLFSISLAAGVFPRARPGATHPGSRCLLGKCGRVTNQPDSTSWIWISDNWPAADGTVVLLQPGLTSTAFLKDTDAFGVPPGCRATDEDGRHFGEGWHKITDLYSGRLTVTCDAQ